MAFKIVNRQAPNLAVSITSDKKLCVEASMDSDSQKWEIVPFAMSAAHDGPPGCIIYNKVENLAVKFGGNNTPLQLVDFTEPQQSNSPLIVDQDLLWSLIYENVYVYITMTFENWGQVWEAHEIIANGSEMWTWNSNDSNNNKWLLIPD